jgi:dTDP-4-amino-4,6-dideoxygalactose transaminase
MDTLGMSPDSMLEYLNKNAEIRNDGDTYNKRSGSKIKACIPMHTFGLPCRIVEIAEICKKWNITLIEDAAESLGSYYKGKHTGIYGELGVISFNGNKTVTCGGGGAIITNNAEIAKRAKHLTTQAKVPHPWAFTHDEIGYNYRMPNLNAALACAQLEQLTAFLLNKRELAENYKMFFKDSNIEFVNEPINSKANFWLNAILLKDKSERDNFLKYSNDNGIMTRPVWDLMHTLKMFEDSDHDNLNNSLWIADRLVNIPSSVRL